MSFPLIELCESFPELLVKSMRVHGDFSSIDSPQAYNVDSLLFISDSKELPNLDDLCPAAIVATADIALSLEQSAPPSLSIFTSPNVRLAQALIKQHYQDYDSSDSEWDAIHPSAVIHPSANIASTARIGPNSVVGQNVHIGVNTYVRANVVIETGTTIGKNCIINNLANIGQGCVLGDRVTVQAGAVIGSEGFGFAQDQNGAYQRIPHTGIVVLEDDVQIGSNSNIDRATYGQTIIKRGVKIDALVHIAHNCLVDEDTILTAQTAVAGSSKIGKRVIASGQTGILDHKVVADDAVLVHRCGVTEDVTKKGMWAGTPPKPFKEYVANLNTRKLLEKRLAKLEARLHELES